MSFTTVFFIFIFFPVCLTLFYLLCRKSEKIANIYLLIVSLAFYSWAIFGDVFKLIIILVIFYFFGVVAYILRESKKSSVDKKLVTRAFNFIIAFIIIILFLYKYLNYSVNLINGFLGTGLFVNSIVAPLGISYVIFSVISYVVDIYRGDEEPRSFVEAALFISFFPKIMSGPITQYRDFYKNKIENKFDIDNIIYGTKRIIIGMTKKIIFADYFGTALSKVPIVGIDSNTVILSVIVYSFQLYFDFSAYSDIAIGIARLFGYTLPENFNLPYRSKSIINFWRRWHMSLGAFFRQYVYFPLGGSRKGNFRTVINLFIVFLISGVWHGTGIRYIIWGVVHAGSISIERSVREKNWYKKIPGVFKWFLTLFIVFTVNQLFRMRFDDACTFYSNLFIKSNIQYTWQYYLNYKLLVMLTIGLLYSLGLFRFIKDRIKSNIPENVYQALSYLMLIVLLILSITVMVSSNYSPFIYFKY